jgi:hypothetical protein
MLNINNKVKYLIVSDFNNEDLSKEIFMKDSSRIFDIINFLQEFSDVSVQVFDKTLTMTVNKNLVGITLLEENINWPDILTTSARINID